MSAIGYRANEICSKLSFSKATLYRWVKNGSFPPGIKIGSGVRIWLESDIEKFLSDLSCKSK